MKQYVIDEFRFEDYEKLKRYLGDHFKESDLGGIYWIPLESQYLNDIQIEHADCQPFYFAVELDSTSLACEFLIRTQNRVRCACMGYAEPLQRERIMRFIDGICETLEIVT